MAQASGVKLFQGRMRDVDQTMNLDLGRVQLPYLAALQRTTDVLAVSAAGVTLVDVDQYSARTAFFQVQLADRLPFEIARQEASRWHLANAFRDAIDVTGVFLDNVRDVAA